MALTDAERQRRYRKRHPERVRAKDARKNAKRKGDPKWQEYERQRSRRRWEVDPDNMRADARRRMRKWLAADAANRELSRKRYREWAATNPEKHAQRLRDWRAANPEKNRQYVAARRARKRDAFVEDVRPLVVLELADGVCGICGADVDPFAFEVDHVMPLSRGGEHSYANVQPAHPICNRRKWTS